jgi:hypothetical protein
MDRGLSGNYPAKNFTSRISSPVLTPIAMQLRI